jgi:hypothetical protein
MPSEYDGSEPESKEGEIDEFNLDSVELPEED